MINPLKEIIQIYREMLENGDNLALIDLYYDEEIQQVENEELPVKGKAAIREIEIANIEGVNSFEQHFTTLVIDEEKGIVMGEMEIVFDSKKYGLKRLNEAVVQHWKNGKMVYQKFYYKSFVNVNG